MNKKIDAQEIDRALEKVNKFIEQQELILIQLYQNRSKLLLDKILLSEDIPLKKRVQLMEEAYKFTNILRNVIDMEEKKDDNDNT